MGLSQGQAVKQGTPCRMASSSKYYCMSLFMLFSSQHSINLPLQARQKWSQFQFFISRIETSIGTGLTASQAVQAFEDRRLTSSMPQLHRKLQSKRQKKDKVNASSPESTASSSGDIVMAT
jgi:hypothetical protein